MCAACRPLKPLIYLTLAPTIGCSCYMQARQACHACCQACAVCCHTKLPQQARASVRPLTTPCLRLCLLQWGNSALAPILGMVCIFYHSLINSIIYPLHQRCSSCLTFCTIAGLGLRRRDNRARHRSGEPPTAPLVCCLLTQLLAPAHTRAHPRKPLHPRTFHLACLPGAHLLHHPSLHPLRPHPTPLLSFRSCWPSASA